MTLVVPAGAVGRATLQLDPRVSGLDASPTTLQLVDVEGVVTAERRRDCRRADLFRTAFAGTAPDALSQVRFAESARLPEELGRRTLLVPSPSPLLVDSFVTDRTGAVTVTHVGGGPERSLLDIFELDADERIVVLRSDLDAIGRASATIALLPGTYGYVLRAADDRPLVTPMTIELELGFVEG